MTPNPWQPVTTVLGPMAPPALFPVLAIALCAVSLSGCAALSKGGGSGAQEGLVSLPATALERRARQAHPPCPEETSLMVEWSTEDVTPAPFFASCARPGGPRHGPAAEWLESGTKTSAGLYADGAKTGKWTGFDPRGARVWERQYRAGRLQGSTRSWHGDGTLATEGAWVEGVRYQTWSSETPDAPPIPLVEAVLAGLRDMLADQGVDFGLWAGRAPEAPRIMLSSKQKSALRRILLAALVDGQGRPSDGLALTPPPWDYALVVARPLVGDRVVLHPMVAGALRLNLREPWSTQIAGPDGDLDPMVFDLPMGEELSSVLEEVLPPPKGKAYRRAPGQRGFPPQWPQSPAP